MELFSPDHGLDPATTPEGLPRLSIQHLLAWTAVTALALLPYNLQQQSLAQNRAASSTAASTFTGISVVSAIAAGTYLFVAGCVLRWKRRGLQFGLQPGHWLALEGVLGFVLLCITWLTITLLQQTPTRIGLLITLLRMPMGLVVLLWFLWLAIRNRRESIAWRFAYAWIAVLPIVMFFSMFIVSRLAVSVIGGGAVSPLAVVMGGLAAIQATLVGLALLADRVGGVERHWSHWLAATARLLTMAAVASYYGLLALGLSLR
jgi:hypothetical protein